jgi:PTS system nitrogen regulatory IIA component
MIDLIKRGGVWYELAGENPAAFLTGLVGSIALPATIDRALLLQTILERESLMSTAMGMGIAIPHPRNPLIQDVSEQFVSIAFPRHPIDWNALDGVPVNTVILIVSASAKLHLKTLSEVNFLCQQDSFRKLLDTRPSQEIIIEVIHAIETTWRES